MRSVTKRLNGIPKWLFRGGLLLFDSLDDPPFLSFRGQQELVLCVEDRCQILLNKYAQSSDFEIKLFLIIIAFFQVSLPSN